MKLAIFDLGTNIFTLLLTTVSNEGCTIERIEKVGATIGRGGFSSCQLTEEAIDHALSVVGQLKEEAEEWGAEHIKLFATSAIRDSNNGGCFVEAVKKSYGLEIEVITGEREAELIYKGVRESLLLYDQRVVIMDIGGGSNEMIIADNEEILFKASYPIGVIRIKETIAPSDPISLEEQRIYREEIDRTLAPFFREVERLSPQLIIGTSGSFDTLRELIFPQDNFAIPAMELPVELFAKLHSTLLLSTKEERLKMHKISPLRADYMVIGSIFVNHIIEKTGIDLLYQSSYSLKEGYMAEFAEKIEREI